MSLRELAQAAGVELGCALTGWAFNDPEHGPLVRETIAREFTLATIEHGFYWSHIEPQRGRWTPETADVYDGWTSQHGMRTRGHALCYPGWATPAWVSTITDADEMRAVIREHVRRMVDDFGCDEYVVVNESYLAGHLERQHDPFFHALGYEYMALAFQAVYDADDTALAIYGDTLNHASDGVNGITTELTRTNLAYLKAQGLITDRFRLGVQLHLRAHDLPSVDDFKRTITRYAEDFGCQVAVIEYDCDMSGIGGTQAERAARHAEITGAFLRGYLDAGVGRSWTTWGIMDRCSWLEMDMGKAAADATLFDDAVRAKPAYHAVVDVLKG